MPKFDKIHKYKIEEEKEAIRQADKKRTALMMKERAKEKARILKAPKDFTPITSEDDKAGYIITNWGAKKRARFEELAESVSEEEAFNRVEYKKGE